MNEVLIKPRAAGGARYQMEYIYKHIKEGTTYLLFGGRNGNVHIVPDTHVKKQKEAILKAIGSHSSPHTPSNCTYCKVEKLLTKGF